MPTNLHLQVFGISTEQSRELITCGTASAIPCRFAVRNNQKSQEKEGLFQNGGLTRLHATLEMDNANLEVPFFSKRNGLLDLKRSIGELSRK